MKPIHFTEQEKTFLIERLQKRLVYCQSKAGLQKHSEVIEETIGKLSSKTDAYYGSKHRLKMTSVSNEFLHSSDEFLREYHHAQSLRFVEASDKAKQYFDLFDFCYDILEKAGCRKSKFKFKQIINKIERLRNCKEIYLSRTDHSNVYKIAFGDNNQVFTTWDIQGRVNIRSDKFKQLSKWELMSLKKSFTDVLSRSEAREIISICRSDRPSNDVLRLTEALLY